MSVFDERPSLARASRDRAIVTHEGLCERSETTAELARVNEHRAVYAMARERARLADGHERRVAGNLKQPLGRPRHAVRRHVAVHERAGLIAETSHARCFSSQNRVSTKLPPPPSQA